MKEYHILKSHCKKIFWVGAGNFWYEKDDVYNDQRPIYKAFSAFLFFMYGSLTVLEIMAALFGNFPEDEKRDSITFAVSHSIVMIKMISVIYNKTLIRKLNLDIVTVCEEYEEESLMTEKYKIMKVNIIAYFVTVYVCAACFVFEGVRKMYEGSHFMTVVTYYPSYGNDSILANVLRTYFTIVLLLMLMTMIISVDTFTMMNLIIYKYKIITLRHYFENLRNAFDNIIQSGDNETAAKKLTQGLIKGIIIHNNLLRLLTDIHKAFGLVMTLQLCQSSGSAVSLLLQIALTDQLTFVAMMKIIFFVFGLFFMLGLFLCNAGEITYQASLLSDSIFYCGWYECPSQNKNHSIVGSLVLQATTQAQKPLLMKAFKMIDLTYSTFLLVIRGTYSVFALLYAQNQ